MLLISSHVRAPNERIHNQIVEVPNLSTMEGRNEEGLKTGFSNNERINIFQVSQRFLVIIVAAHGLSRLRCKAILVQTFHLVERCSAWCTKENGKIFGHVARGFLVPIAIRNSDEGLEQPLEVRSSWPHDLLP